MNDGPNGNRMKRDNSHFIKRIGASENDSQFNARARMERKLRQPTTIEVAALEVGRGASAPRIAPTEAGVGTSCLRAWRH